MTKASDFQGLITDGVYKALGWTPDRTIASVVDKDLVDLANRADAGDREALVELSQKMAGKKVSVMGTENVSNMVNSIMKADPNAGSYTIAKSADEVGDIPEELLIKNIEELTAKNRMQFNLHAINNEGDFNKTIDDAVADYTKLFSKNVPETNAEIIAASKEANESLSYFMGKDVTHFSRDEANAFRAIGNSSARQIVEYSQILNSKVVSPAAKDVARVALAKQMQVHLAIQDKITKVGSEAGSLLESFNTRIC